MTSSTVNLIRLITFIVCLVCTLVLYMFVPSNGFAILCAGGYFNALVLLGELKLANDRIEELEEQLGGDYIPEPRSHRNNDSIDI